MVVVSSQNTEEVRKRDEVKLDSIFLSSRSKIIFLICILRLAGQKMFHGAEFLTNIELASLWGQENRVG
jgi:hypothetical protein